MANGSVGEPKLKTFRELLEQKLAREGWSLGMLPINGASHGAPGAAQPALQPRPDLNGKILANSAGTLFTVIGGIAYGFISDDVYRRIHYRCYKKDIGDCGSWWPPRAGVCVHVTTCPRFYPFENWPDVQTAIMDPFCALRISPENGAVYLLRDGYRHGITSGDAFDNYQFNWDCVKPWDLPLEVWRDLKDGAYITETKGGRFDP